MLVSWPKLILPYEVSAHSLQWLTLAMLFLDVTGTSLYKENGHIYGFFVDAITLPFKNVTTID